MYKRDRVPGLVGKWGPGPGFGAKAGAPFVVSRPTGVKYGVARRKMPGLRISSDSKKVAEAWHTRNSRVLPVSGDQEKQILTFGKGGKYAR